MLVQGLWKLKIISPFGKRFRNGRKESHEGMDFRIFNKAIDPYAQHIFPIIAPEAIKITEVNLDEEWGHWIKAEPIEPNEWGIVEFRFWHIVPVDECVPGAIFEQDKILGMPESGWVDLHLHWETRTEGTPKRIPIDPMPYLEARGQEFE